MQLILYTKRPVAYFSIIILRVRECFGILIAVFIVSNSCMSGISVYLTVYQRGIKNTPLIK